MTWREDLRRVIIDGRSLVGASFRGVPFLVRESELGGGKRLAKHQFPFRRELFAEDLGPDEGAFRVDGYVIGDDYHTKRDALLAALEATGPGELVHPNHGRRVAIPEQWTVRQTTADGGVAWFAITFVETPAQAPVPSEIVAPVDQLAATADAANEATSEEFADSFDPEDLPSFALESAETALATAAEAVGAALAPFVTVTQELATFNGRLQIIIAQAGALVRSPSDVLPSFLEAIQGLTETIEDAPRDVMEALLDTYEATLGELVTFTTTATRERERANQDAIIAALRRTMLAEAARMAPRAPFRSTDEAIDARDRISAALEAQEGTADDIAYPALVELRAQICKALPGDDLARIVTVTPKTAIPSLVLAHQLYGSVELEADIIERNGVRHPGFLLGALRVLSDA